MKSVKTFIVVAFLLPVVTLFTSSGDPREDGIIGEGPVNTENIDIQEIKGVSIDIPATVYISRGDVQVVRIEAQQNILENIHVAYRNNLIHLNFIDPVLRCEPIEVHVTLASLLEVSISGEATVVSDSVFVCGNELLVNISGAGKVSLKAHAAMPVLNISGAGVIDLEGNSANLIANVSGAGLIRLHNGLTQKSLLRVSGAGKVESDDFGMNHCTVESTGKARVHVKVFETLNVKIEGDSQVFFTGHPSIVSQIKGNAKLVDANPKN